MLKIKRDCATYKETEKNDGFDRVLANCGGGEGKELKMRKRKRTLFKQNIL